MHTRTATLLAITALLTVSCAGPETDTDRGPSKLVVYSGRNERLIGPLLEQFERQHQIQLEVRYGSTSGLASTLMEEGSNTPAGLFISQDAAALGALSGAGMLQVLEPEVLESVAPEFRSDKGDWIGISGRARTVVFNTQRIKPDQLPQSLEAVADPRFRGRFGLAPSNASFQAHMAAYLAAAGEQALRELLAGIVANEPRIYPKNAPIVEAVIAGEIDWGLVNHYYLLRALAENPEAPAENFVMNDGPAANFVNIAGAGLLSENPAGGQLVRFLLSPIAQEYFAENTFEYPLTGDNPGQMLRGTRADFGNLSAAIERTLELIHESGLNRFQ